MGLEVALLIRPVTKFIRKGSVFANRALPLHLLRTEVPLLIGPDTTFIRKGSVLANRVRPYIY